MRIAIVSGIGEGQTLLSSFDAALHRCGVGNYNLLVLSSVIPPRSRIETGRPHQPGGDEHGHRLYVVKAESRSARRGEAVAAGIGWYQWGDGRGVFVEHEAHGDDEAAVAAAVSSLLRASLRDLCATRRIAFDECAIGALAVSATVRERPTTALVVAVFRAEGWDEPPREVTHVARYLVRE
jgi:arginine decarboxylase